MLALAWNVFTAEPKKLTIRCCIALVCTLVGDLLEPLWEWTLIFLVGFVVVLLWSLVRLHLWRGRLRKAGRTPDPVNDASIGGERLTLSVSVAGVVLTLGILGLQGMSGATETGLLAAKSEPFAALQRQLGMTHQKLDAISRQVDHIDRTMEDVKQETSEDPRKELANLGVPWGTQSFVDAMIAGDSRTMQLFLDGGMRPGTIHKGSSAILYAIQRETTDPVGMVRMALAAGFDVNQRLVDTRTLLDPGAINHFDGPHTPKGYETWRKRFAGPMLLWIACRATWEGADETDWKLIDLLLDHDAEVQTTLAYLRFHRNDLGEMDGTGGYARLQRLLEARARASR
jgi:hypothetical protein